LYKTPEGSGLAYTGIAGITDFRDFFDGLEAGKAKTGETQVNAGFEAILRREVKAIPMPWIDTGTDDNYRSALERYDRNYTAPGKNSDALYHVGGNIIKFFPDPQVACNVYTRGKSDPRVFAPVGAYRGNFFSYRFVDGAVLADCLTEVKMRETLEWCQHNVWKTTFRLDAEFIERCRKFYVEKSADRLQAFLDHYMPQGESSPVEVNGISCRGVRELLHLMPRPVYETPLPSSFHGDLHMDNILEKKDGSFIGIDWRESFGGDLEKGDRYYDLAKLYHTLDFSPHEAMENDQFEMIEGSGGSLRIAHRDTELLRRCRSIFQEFCAKYDYDLARIHFLNGLIFVNMSPLYARDLGTYLYWLGRLRMEESLRLSLP
jgi:hypothetical protein